MKIPTWVWALYLLIGLTLEAFALMNGWAGDTATEVILRTAPGWMIYAVLGWLLWHFRKAR